MTTPTQAGAEAALIAQYNAQTQQMRTALAAFLAHLWASLRGDYRSANEDRFVAQAVPASQGAQRAVSATTTAYLARLISAMTGTPPRIPTVPQAQVTGEALRGVDPAVVYSRPLEQARYALSVGKSLDQASAIGARRAQSIGLTDLQLAKTHTARQVMQGDRRIVGYRRVLTGAHSCALCLIASTQRYHKADLLPLHPQCDCSVAPIVGTRDPGQIIDETTLEAVHDAVARDLGAKYVDRGARGPLDYRKVIVTHDHGELGPVLGVKGQNFDGPADVNSGHPAEVSEPDPRAVARRQLDVLEANLPKLEARAAAGEDVTKPLAYHRKQIDVLRTKVEGG